METIDPDGQTDGRTQPHGWTAFLYPPIQNLGQIVDCIIVDVHIGRIPISRLCNWLNDISKSTACTAHELHSPTKPYCEYVIRLADQNPVYTVAGDNNLVNVVLGAKEHVRNKQTHGLRSRG